MYLAANSVLSGVSQKTLSETIRITEQNFLDLFPQKLILLAEWARSKLIEDYPDYSTGGQNQL